MIRCHIIAFLGGFLLDMILGDPYWLPHPIRLTGKLISVLEARLLGKKAAQDPGEETECGPGGGTVRDPRREVCRGRQMVILVLTITMVFAALILLAAYKLHRFAGLLVELVMTYQILAAKCLKVESMKVYDCLKKQDINGARGAVSMIVGRDTQCLDEMGIARAAIETVAENTSDGVIAPMLYTALGGPVLGFFYKAVNTMDSMVGYRNDRYLHFGRAAARLDDFVNFLPARISAFFMIFAAFLPGKAFDGKNAVRIYRRDRRKHASPNSAQTESVCAGALGIQLAGDAVYFGKVVKKPFIGDPVRPAEYEDIRRANHLMYRTAWICEILCLALMLLLGYLI